MDEESVRPEKITDAESSVRDTADVSEALTAFVIDTEEESAILIAVVSEPTTVLLKALASVMLTDAVSVEENEFTTVLMPSAMPRDVESVRLRVKLDNDASAMEMAEVSDVERITSRELVSLIPKDAASVAPTVVNEFEESEMLNATASVVCCVTAMALASLMLSAIDSLPVRLLNTLDASVTLTAAESLLIIVKASVRDSTIDKATESVLFSVDEIARDSATLMAAVSVDAIVTNTEDASAIDIAGLSLPVIAWGTAGALFTATGPPESSTPAFWLMNCQEY